MFINNTNVQRQPDNVPQNLVTSQSSDIRAKPSVQLIEDEAKNIMLPFNKNGFVHPKRIAGKDCDADDVILVELATDPAKLPHTSKASEEFILSNRYNSDVTAADASDSVVLEVDQKKIKGCSKEINCTDVQYSVQGVLSQPEPENNQQTSHKT